MQTTEQTVRSTRYADFEGQYIAGQWRPGRAKGILTVSDPYREQAIAEISLGSRDDLNEAYEVAAKAQVAWAQTLPSRRSAVFRRVVAILEARREEIIDWLIREAGSTRTKAQIEWQTVHSQAVECCSLPFRMDGRILPVDVPGKESRVYRKPLGVVGVISPWNWPMTLSHRSVGPALALGNAVVLKPADDTPITGGLLIARIYEEAGLPESLLNVVIGEIGEIGDAFTLHPTPRLISFTGSTRVGRHVAMLASTGPTIKRVALELGGNNPLVVLDDADIDLAARATVFGRFLHQGQICMSVNRVIVDASVYEPFIEKLVERVRALKRGDPDQQGTAIGPVINRRQLAGMLERISEAQASGLEPLIGGDPEGLVLPPHVFRDVQNTSPLAQAELFGPILPIIRASNEEHALSLANQTEYGLSSAVFSQDERRALRFSHRLNVGMSHINDMSVNASVLAPFGGEKNSGLGRFGGDSSIHEFSTEHWVTVQSSPRSYPF